MLPAKPRAVVAALPFKSPCMMNILIMLPLGYTARAVISIPFKNHSPHSPSHPPLPNHSLSFSLFFLFHRNNPWGFTFLFFFLIRRTGQSTYSRRIEHIVKFDSSSPTDFQEKYNILYLHIPRLPGL